METARKTALAADVTLAVVTAIWGTTFIVNRLVLESAPPLLFLTLRFGVAAIVLAALAWGRADSPGIRRDGALVGVLLGISIACQVVGQLFTSASKTAFITGLSVPLTPVVAFLVAKKLPSPANLVGLVLAAAGFSVFAWPADATGVEPGDFLVLVTAVLYAWIIFYVGETAPRHDARRYAAHQVFWAALTVALARLVLMPFLHGKGTFLVAEARPLPVTGGFLAAVLWMALIATVVTFIAQTWAQARMSAVHAAILYALEPVWTSIFAWMVLGERLARRDLVGASLILSGILVSEVPWRSR
jgi:drug/metabolite transporter (DMT)-like permease